MSTGDTFSYWNYSSDNGHDYVIRLSGRIASAGGFGPSTGSPLDPGSTFWPFHPRDMRHVTGRASDGSHARLPIGTSGNSLYVSGGTFTLNGKGYVVTGAEGERRVARDAK